MLFFFDSCKVWQYCFIMWKSLILLRKTFSKTLLGDLIERILNNSFFQIDKTKKCDPCGGVLYFSKDLFLLRFMSSVWTLNWHGIHTVTTHVLVSIKWDSPKDMKAISIYRISVIKENLIRMKLRELKDEVANCPSNTVISFVFSPIPPRVTIRSRVNVSNNGTLANLTSAVSILLLIWLDSASWISTQPLKETGFGISVVQCFGGNWTLRLLILAQINGTS